MSDAYLFDKLKGPDWFFWRIATDKDLGRPDRRERIAMGLTYCENCQQLEGDTHYDNELDETVCDDCGEPVRDIPEHDDYEDR